MKTWEGILFMSIVWTPCFLQWAEDVVQAVMPWGGRTPGKHRLEGSGTDQWLLSSGLEEWNDTQSGMLFPILGFYIQSLLLADNLAKVLLYCCREYKELRMSHILKLENYNWLLAEINIVTCWKTVQMKRIDFFFQSCLFILEIEPLKRAELPHYKLAVLKATQQ